jgi:hypothetical protein
VKLELVIATIVIILYTETAGEDNTVSFSRLPKEHDLISSSPFVATMKELVD